MNEIKIIIQARTGSTRLPQKMILPFYENEGIFSLILKRLTSIINKNDIILATSTNENNDVLTDIAKEYGVNYFRGLEIFAPRPYSGRIIWCFLPWWS